jgi:hypothetical protein
MMLELMSNLAVTTAWNIHAGLTHGVIIEQSPNKDPGSKRLTCMISDCSRATTSTQIWRL